MKNNPVVQIASECWKNRYRLWGLAVYDLKVRNSDTFLGFSWNFLNPALQIFVYWFVFAIGLRSNSPRDGYSYFIWMIFGIMPWFFISNAMNGSISSIVAFRGVLKRMRFPVAIVPVKVILSAFIEHLFTMAVTFVIFFAGGYHMGIHAVNLIYFMICELVFLTGFGLFASAVNVVFRDFQKIMSAVLRLLFYLSPVLWSPDSLPEKYRFALKLNPIAYILDGYRESILYNYPLSMHWKYALYFWAITIIMLAAGASVHKKLCRQFMDVI